MIINEQIFNEDLTTILHELKTQLNINGINYLHAIKDTPDNIMISCPYHKGGQERRPSAGIKKIDGTFHCFACGEIHTLQEMISHCFGKEDITGAFGWNWLLKNFLTVNIEERKDIEIDFSRKYTNNINDNIGNNSNFISEEELDTYRYYHPYMYKRGLTNEIIEAFDIGYDSNTSCITFPIRNIDGKCLFVARRSVNTKFFNYPHGVEKPVYGLYELKQLDKFPKEIIICESMLDALTCWVYGKYAVALNGLGNELQFKQLNSMPCRKFILATDMDEAGKKARDRIRKNLNRKLVTEFIWDVTKAKDINDMEHDMFNNLMEIF